MRDKNLELREVEYLAKLSKIYLSKEEVGDMSQDLGKIIGMINKVSELDTTGLEPLYNIEEGHKNTTRKDEVKSSVAAEMIEKNSDHFNSGHFVVPQVVE